jgi:RNA polymerase sigma-70 factor (ECF subfamily)
MGQDRRNAADPGGVHSPVEPTPARPAPTPEELLDQRLWVESLARRLVRDRNDADDVVQEAWLKALTRRPARFTSVRGWLAAVVRSCAMDAHRSGARREAREKAAGPRAEGPLPPSELVARAEAQRRVLTEVLALDEAHRTVVLLRFIEGMEPGEIAARLGEPPGTVRSRLHRALETLRERLDRAWGGDRAAWALAVLGPRALEGTGAAKVGGVIAMSAKTKAAVAAAVLLLLALAGTAVFRSHDAPAPRVPAREAASAVGAAAPGAAPPAPASVPATAPAPAVLPDAAAAAPAADSPPAGAGPRRLPLEPMPPRDPDPPPRIAGAPPGVPVDADDDEGEPPFRIVGWTKWKPVPEKGTATLRGRVIDEAGRPLAGAEVLRIDPKAGGVDGDVVSFEHIRAVATTGPDGTFAATEQPARPARLAANWRAAMSRPRGLLFHALVPVDPREGGTVDGIVLRLPVRRDAYGAVSGRVVDDEGVPVGGADVAAGFHGTRTGPDGRFRLEGVPAGSASLVASRYGYRAWRQSATVPPGQTVEVEAVLPLKGAGACELAGRVVDDAGRPAPGLPVWCGGAMDLSRDAVTDADGRFRFRRLPDLGDERVCVSLMTDPGESEYLPATVQDVRVPTPGLVLTAERTTVLRVLVRDREGGAIQPLFNADVRRETVVDGEAVLVPFRSATLHEEDGAWDLRVPRGRLVLFVEAPDRRPVHAAVTVPSVEGPFEVLFEMDR